MFKLCMIIALLEVYSFIVGLMTLTLFQGYRCVRNINWILCFFFFFLILVLSSFNISWLLHTWKKIMHNNKYDSCEPSVYLREIIARFWPVKFWACQKKKKKKGGEGEEGICSDTIGVINVKRLHDSTTHWALPVHTTFNDLNHISRPQQH